MAILVANHSLDVETHSERAGGGLAFTGLFFAVLTRLFNRRFDSQPD